MNPQRAESADVVRAGHSVKPKEEPQQSAPAGVVVVKRDVANSGKPVAVPAQCIKALVGTMEEPDGIALQGNGVSPYSLDAPLPAGAVFQAIGRSRGTTNVYVTEMATIGWANRFKVPTIAALAHRLRSHTHEISGKVDPDVEMGFVDIINRLDHLLNCHKKSKRGSTSTHPFC